MVESKIEQLLLKKFEEEEYSDCFIIEILQNNIKLQIFLDSDSNMDFAKCRKISRYLEEHIDENQWLGEKYILEVSSPGVGKPLMVPQQYALSVGRSVKITMLDGEIKIGDVTSFKYDCITIGWKERVPKEIGKGKMTVSREEEIKLEDVKETRLEIRF